MKIEQLIWTKYKGWEIVEECGLRGKAQLLLAFGDRQLLEGMDKLLDLRHMYSAADIVLCSTAGEIMDVELHDDTISAVAIYWEKSHHKVVRLKIDGYANSYQVGKDLVTQLPTEELKHVFLLADGLSLNGNEFVRGAYENLPSSVSINGGLAGDGFDFQRTLLGFNRLPESGVCLAIGFYGKDLLIGQGAAGSWEELRQEYIITRSDYNRLYELNHTPASKIYQEKLGDAYRHFNTSPYSFPVEIWADNNKNDSFVRMVKTIDDSKNALLMAGDAPQGFSLRILQTNVDLMLKGARRACEKALKEFPKREAMLILLVNCLGRREILRNRTEEELEIARDLLGEQPVVCGMYGYGVLAAWTTYRKPFLQHQAYLITVLGERK
ncbi:MAG: FIST C-terminal domain-containing protein [Flammeovirgaceae bacterium]|nr:FIST C-terminal domain-containing protein [Flammeovirgaceae bacterium]MDW8288405.1 FIST N-terminal domain-containing protein [Flammeovirgaceae bacterium]